MSVVLDPARPGQTERACRILERGEAVALPTETVYGLAADAFRPEALARIFSLKARPTFDPLIVHVLDHSWIEIVATESSALHWTLMERFWPGPLTLLFRKTDEVPDLCTAGTEFVAVRCPSHPVFRKILADFGRPLAAPSANRFGRISPTSALDVCEELGPFGLEAVVDGGRCEWGLESTVVKILSESAIEIVRAGALSAEKIRAALPKNVEIRVNPSGSGVKREGFEAPGQLESHYAPRKPLFFVSRKGPTSPQQGPSAALLVPLRRDLEAFPELAAREWASIEVLSETNSWTDAASKLFATLRRIDGAKSPSAIVALETEDRDLGVAINDRLRRASKKS